MAKIDEEAFISDVASVFSDLAVHDAASVVMDLYSNIASDLEDICFYEMGSFNEMFDGVAPLDVLERVVQPFDTNADFYRFTIAGCESVDEDEAMTELQARDMGVAARILKYVNSGHDIEHWPAELQSAISEYL